MIDESGSISKNEENLFLTHFWVILFFSKIYTVRRDGCITRVGGGGWCFPFRGSLGGFPSEGSRMGFLCLLEGRVWGLITGNHANQCLVNSRPVEAFEMSIIYESLTPPKKVLQ